MNLKEMLLIKGIVKIRSKDHEPFTLKSGKKSRLFIDIKEASLNPYILKKVVDEFNELIPYKVHLGDYSIFGSVAIGGIPIATALSLEYGIPQIIIRSEKHDSGIKTQIIGKCKDKRILLIEDVATTGGSIVSAVQVIREAGGICDDCVVVVDREEGASENCKENGINLFSLLKKSDFGVDEEL